MRELLLEAFRLGIGAADMTVEQMEKLVHKYAKEAEDGRQMLDELAVALRNRTRKSGEEIEHAVARAMRGHKKELEALSRELKRLTSKIKTLSEPKGPKSHTLRKRTRKK